ncbi:MAG: trypsin-like peptidase domain-containing protein [Planctomycetaceae bacterium]|jgi:hypothetical protein|nr:trypsin-like peptidase domain-containing protein [Planctomycetaceae bacterium]
MKNNLQTQFLESELAIAAVAALVWSLLGLSLEVLGRPAVGHCQSVQTAPNAASCRVHNQLSGGANVGSGTLIDVTASGERGLVLTCAHLFTEGTGQVVVEFPNGKCHGALVVAIDQQADLAALEIARPPALAVEVNQQTAAVGNLTACGFGPTGAYRCVAGPVLGYSESPGQTSVRIGGAVRSGDSGGGVFDNRGRLVAVVWGESGGVTYASTGRPLGRFLERVLGRRANGGASSPFANAPRGGLVCPNGTCPLIGGEPQTPNVTTPATPPVVESPGQSCECGNAMAAIAARLDAMEFRQVPSTPASGAGSGGELPATVSGVARAAATLATTLLGVSGPAGWGIIAATTVGGWLFGRGLKRRKLRVVSRELREKEPAFQQAESLSAQLAAHDSPLTTSEEATAAAAAPFQNGRACEHGQTIVVDEQSPIERDDREARELLRLSQLEGRDPLRRGVVEQPERRRCGVCAGWVALPQRGSVGGGAAGVPAASGDERVCHQRRRESD